MDSVSARAHHIDMTFTLPRFSRRTAAPAPLNLTTRPAPQPAPAAPLTVVVEVVLPQGMQPDTALLSVYGWTLRLWPQARLGDATLQAHASSTELTLASLLDALHNQGIQTLGVSRRAA